MKVLLPCIVTIFSIPAIGNESENGPNNELETITVYAQKHAQDLEDVAVSVNVISGRKLSEQNIKDTTALSAFAPNFKITQNAAEGTPPAVNIRGVGSLDYNTSTTSPVGIYVDEVAGGSANAQLINLYDIENIEIMRGPQGTLFGRNTTAGAIAIRTQRPNDSFEGYVDAGVAEYNHSKLSGAINLPINQSVNSRVAFSRQSYDYAVKNLHPQAPKADMTQSAVRFSLAGEWNNLSLFAKVHAEEWDGIVQPVGNIGAVKSIDPVTGAPSAFCTPQEAGSLSCTDAFGFNDGSNDFYDVAVNNNIHGNSPHKSDSWGTDINLTYQLSAKSSLVSLTAINELDRIHFYNSDGSPFGAAEGGQDVFTELFTQEFRYHYDMDQGHFIAGLYFLDESIRQENFLDLMRSLRASPEQFSAAAKFSYDNRIDTTASAVFTHLEYQLTDATSVSAGLRYTWEDLDYRAIGTINVPLSVNDQQGLNVPGWDVSGDMSDNNLSGKLALVHRFSANVSSFVSYSKGFKSGGYNGAIITTPAEAQRNTYGAETLNAYEVGGRFYWPDNNARLNLAAFLYDYNDQQVFMNQQAADPSAPPVQLLDNVGKSSIYGLEADLIWYPIPELNVQISAGYLPEANLESFVDAQGNVILDNRLPFTSERNLSAQLEYVQALPAANLVWQLNFDHQSEFYFDQNQNAYASQQNYTLWNGRIAYETESWTFALWGKNLADEEYSNLKFDLVGLLGMLQDFKGEPRRFGVDVNYSF